MFTLSLVSQKNLPLTILLVSIPSPSLLLSFPYRLKGSIHRGRVWYVNLPNTRENVTYLPPRRITVSAIGPSSVSWDKLQLIATRNSVLWESVRLLDAFIYNKLIQSHRLSMSTFVELATLRVHLLSLVPIFQLTSPV